MDQHSELITTFVKRTLDSNLKKVDENHMKYNDIKMGAKIIWKKYYKNAFMKYETLSSVIKRLNTDMQTTNDDNVYINAYVNMFGKFW